MNPHIFTSRAVRKHYFLFHFVGEAGVVEDEEKGSLLLQLREKSLEVAQLEKQLGDLQEMAKPGSQSGAVMVEEKRSHEREQLQVRHLWRGAGCGLILHHHVF